MPLGCRQDLIRCGQLPANLLEVLLIRDYESADDAGWLRLSGSSSGSNRGDIRRHQQILSEQTQTSKVPAKQDF